MQILKRWSEIIPTLLACLIIILMALTMFWNAILFSFFAMVAMIIHIIRVRNQKSSEQQKTVLIILTYISMFAVITGIWFYRDYRENIVRQSMVEFIEKYYQMHEYHPSDKDFKTQLMTIGNPGMYFYYYVIPAEKGSQETIGYSLSYRTTLGGIFDDIHYLQKSKTWQYIPDFDEEAHELLASEQVINRLKLKK